MPAIRNYQKELDKILSDIPESLAPTLLLHACCAPCASYTLEYLSEHFSISLLFYNPNISPNAEFEKRKAEVLRLIREMPMKHPITVIESEYDTDAFRRAVKGLENMPEGGERCFACYRLRLKHAAVAAKELQCDYFASTLSISPMKNAHKLNEIGEYYEKIYGVRHLPNDFKKRAGYQRSIALSKEYGLYRQDFCGCAFSYAERQRQKAGGEND